MSGNKTIPTSASVKQFIAGVKDAKQRQESLQLLALFEQVTGEKPVMWGSSIIGFGKYHYRYKSGREGDMFLSGFSPRKGALVLYIGATLDINKTPLSELGKHRTGKSCLYIRRLSDVNAAVLAHIIKNTSEKLKQD
jgi:hypothetical protein